MNNPSLEVVIDDTLCIDDLVQLKNQGFSVLRSAHVGNLSPYNLTLAQVGIPILSVDHNMTGVDKNYFPELAASQISNEVIAGLGTLVCRTMIESSQTQIGVTNGGTTYLDNFHIDSVKNAVPGAQIFTNTEYLRANESIAAELVQIASEAMPEIFTRIAMPDGKVAKPWSGASAKIGKLGVMQLSDNPRSEREAVIMPNELDILAGFVIEAIKSERDVQFHLSGPDMVVYVKDKLPAIQELYAKVKKTASFAKKLPDDLVVRLIPSTSAKFATTQARKQKLDILLDGLLLRDTELANLRDERKQFFDPKKPVDLLEKNRFLKGVKAEELIVERVFAEKLATIPELFIEPGSKQLGFITQYDLLDEGGLYVSSINCRLSMLELSIISKKLNETRTKLKS